ncbi:MAG TPA: hypothetical protein VI796_00380 [Candidatus Thermoplasmatota archaeon]|nr:hypothetical protein [Candidatus Thermoplasmatota archaeon]
MAWFHLPSAILGFVVGAIAVAIVLEAMGRGRAKAPASWKLTTAWSLSELGAPLVVAHDLLEADVPTGTRVTASGTVSAEVFAKAEVRQVPPVRAEFAIDSAGTRALLFTAGIRPGAMALLTVDPGTVARLATEARELWESASPYVERVAIAQLGGRSGVVVETEGTVQETLPYKDRFLLRLADGGDIIGVVVAKDPAELRHERIVVRGKLVRDRTGYALIEASDLRRVR